MEEYSTCPICGANQREQVMQTTDYFLTREHFTLEKCQSCGVIFTHPRPNKEALGKYYETKNYLSHNAGNNGITGKIYQFFRRKNIAYKYQLIAAEIPKGKILDIGCGTGELLHYFKGKGWSCTGIEPNGSAREFAKTHYQLSIGEEKDLEKLEEHSFDVITLWHVLEHVPEVNQRMKTIKRLLKKNGLLVIALPNPASYDAQHYAQYWAGYDVPRHLFHFTPEAFKNLSKAHALKIIRVAPLKLDAFYVSYLSEKYKDNNLPLVRATIPGCRSNKKAKKTGNYSSLIYLLKKSDKEA